MSRLFISHSGKDDDFVRDLRGKLVLFGLDGWIDSRELRGGDLLWESITAGIEEADALAVVVSPNAFQSEWVGKEIEHALESEKRVIPLLLDGTELGVLQGYFGGDDPLYIKVSSGAGGVEEAIHEILVAMGKRLPSDPLPKPQPEAEPVEELVLDLSDFKIREEENGVFRASAKGQLVYEPAQAGKERVVSEKWRFVAPLGPIEAEDLRWYLEKYAIWPSDYFKDRAEKVEANLKKWGELLHEAAMPLKHVANVKEAWVKLDGDVRRRFSIHVDTVLEAGISAEDKQTSREAATLLLGLPWELIHDGEGFLFQDAEPIRVRRRLPRTKDFKVPVVAPPIRILLVTARPEDDSCGYIDHRASSKPLVEAIDTLGGLVELSLLSPPTLPALREELDRNHYHVVHFDGHGVYDRKVGLGGLCFEDPSDIGKLTKRRHQTIYTDELGPLLRKRSIPLVFLEACQGAKAEEANESVASALLKVGVASVVAMSHSVLVETARRFVQHFYAALAKGARVGDAMLAGQRALKDDTVRGKALGVGEFTLEDWFVPVLFQEKDDPQLFTAIPAKQTEADLQKALAAKSGDLPPEPPTGFIGRSRELLMLERLLRGKDRYAVIRGQGGEGKTALAAEFGRWMVRSQQIDRAAFVSVETHSNVQAVLHSLGQQLVGEKFAATEFEPAALEVERALTEQSVLLIIDNMESVLLPPYVAEETPEALTEDAQLELESILALCERLNAVGGTCLVFTSREALPAPFDATHNRIELQRLAKEDAVKLVEKTLHEGDQPTGDAAESEQAAIEDLVDTVIGHARTLALLAPSLRSQGVERTTESLVELMAKMEEDFPGSREQSVFASVELSLQRMSAANRERVRTLGVFHGGVNLGILQIMMKWDQEDVVSLAGALIETGLATPNRYNHLTLNPALCPYLRGQLSEAERKEQNTRWIEAMRAYVEILSQQKSKDAKLVATLTGLELPNLFALLDQTENVGDVEDTIDLATSLYYMLHMLGKPQLVERVGRARDIAAKELEGATWNRARFQAQRTRIEQQLTGGQLSPALERAQALLNHANLAGGDAYPRADYDLATACFVLARVLKVSGASERALPLLDKARERFEAISKSQVDKAAERMTAVCFLERGEILDRMGKHNESAEASKKSIQLFEHLNDTRQVAVGKANLGAARLGQRRYEDALEAYTDTRRLFFELDEPGTVAGIWRMIGIVYAEANQLEAAEEAYRKSLAGFVQLSDVINEAGTLGELGNLYGDSLNRPEEAVTFFRQAANKYVEIGDFSSEGLQRSNLSGTLRRLRRFDEAREEIHRAIECKTPYGHASKLWISWKILADIETEAANTTQAAEARQKAIDLYLAYRHDGGEDHSPSGRVFHAVTEALQAGNQSQAEKAIAAFRRTYGDQAIALADVLEAIAIHGSRDRSLADPPELHYTSVAEILFLIETLESG